MILAKNIINQYSNSNRAGVILYDVSISKFIFGIDKKSGDITDFGGGCKKTEDIISTAKRELFEESGYFINYNTLNECYSINFNNVYIIFLPISSFELKKNEEIEDIIYVDNIDRNIINKMYIRIRKVFDNNKNILDQDLKNKITKQFYFL